MADPTPAAVAALAPTGILRAAINTSNFLLVTGRDDDGAPTGVSPDMARELARRLGVDVVLQPYRSPGDLADDAANEAWDIGNIGAEPARAEHIAFTAAYWEIECTYLVPAGSPISAGRNPARASRPDPTNSSNEPPSSRDRTSSAWRRLRSSHRS